MNAGVIELLFYVDEIVERNTETPRLHLFSVRCEGFLYLFGAWPFFAFEGLHHLLHGLDSAGLDMRREQLAISEAVRYHRLNGVAQIQVAETVRLDAKLDTLTFESIALANAAEA